MTIAQRCVEFHGLTLCPDASTIVLEILVFNANSTPSRNETPRTNLRTLPHQRSCVVGDTCASTFTLSVRRCTRRPRTDPRTLLHQRSHFVVGDACTSTIRVSGVARAQFSDPSPLKATASSSSATRVRQPYLPDALPASTSPRARRTLCSFAWVQAALVTPPPILAGACPPVAQCCMRPLRVTESPHSQARAQRVHVVVV
jgi:hypothetical protein